MLRSSRHLGRRGGWSGSHGRGIRRGTGDTRDCGHNDHCEAGGRAPVERPARSGVLWSSRRQPRRCLFARLDLVVRATWRLQSVRPRHGAHPNREERTQRKGRRARPGWSWGGLGVGPVVWVPLESQRSTALAAEPMVGLMRALACSPRAPRSRGWSRGWAPEAVRHPADAAARQRPPTVMRATSRVGAEMLERSSRSLPTMAMSCSICSRLPAMVISSTGKVSSPFSIHRPAAPRE